MANNIQQVLYISWALWLLYSFLLLLLKKNVSQPPPVQNNETSETSGANETTGTTNPKLPNQSEQKTTFDRYFVFKFLGRIPKMWITFTGLFLSTIVILSFFVLLTQDFKADSNFFIKSYEYTFDRQQKEIVVGNSETDTDITLENPWAAERHLKIIPRGINFEIQNISDDRKVDVNGRSLSQITLKTGDVIEIEGKEKIRILKINPQFPLGRSLLVSLTRNGKKTASTATLYTLLNKRKPLGEKGAALLEYIPNKQFLGTNIYYTIVIAMVFLLSLAIYFYLRNHFNGALLLLMIVSLIFGAGFITLTMQVVLMLLFIPFIFYVEKRRKTHWQGSSILVILLYIVVFFSPQLLRMDGDFILDYTRFSRKDTPGVKVIPAGSISETGNNKDSFDLFDKRKTLDYGKVYEVILGHTRYDVRVDNVGVSLNPRDPEKIKISRDFAAITGDLSEIKPGNNYVYLKFPHEFVTIPAKSIIDRKEIYVRDAKGNGITLSKTLNENYRYYFFGLIFAIIAPFWIFWYLNYLLPFMRRRYQKRKSDRLTIPEKNSQFVPEVNTTAFFNNKNFIVYNFVYFLLGIGYVVFGALALYNNNLIKNFSKFRTSALPIFVILFLGFIMLSRYNRFFVFLTRVLRQRKYLVPLLMFSGLLIASFSITSYYKWIFLAAAGLFFIFIFGFKLRKTLLFEYKNTHNYSLDLKRLMDTPVSNFEDKENRRMFFGLGELLNRKGWNYLLFADLLLLLALFFIVIQTFLGGELGLTMGGFLFFPIELGKILLAIYFADWVSRIDKGMEFNVLWVYALVLIPFLLLIVFVKDFSPLLIFVFVFFYHIIKIKKSIFVKLLLIISALIVMRQSVVAFSNYTIPGGTFAILFSIPVLIVILRVWTKRHHKQPGRFDKHKKIAITAMLALLLIAGNYFLIFGNIPVARVLGDRLSSWLNPWQDYDLSYQYINSLWLMKGAGSLGKTTDALIAAWRVPLVEKDLIFSLYISMLGIRGIVLLMLTIFLSAAVVFRQGGSTWHKYVMEFLAVIFIAQFLVPIMYTVGLLPLMGQPSPFLSYSNNLLLLFTLPFSALMFILAIPSEMKASVSNAACPPIHDKQKLNNHKFENKPSYAFLSFCLIIMIFALLALLRLYSIAYPKDTQEMTDIVYLESLNDYSSIFKLRLNKTQFQLIPQTFGLQISGKKVTRTTDIHNGDIISVGDKKFQFKVYPGEYVDKEVFCRPLSFVFPGPMSVKYISGWSSANRQQRFAYDKNIELLQKTIVEIMPEELDNSEPGSSDIVFEGPVLELNNGDGSLKVRPFIPGVVRIRDLTEKKVEKDSYISIMAGDVLKIHPALYLKFGYRFEEGEDCLVISYRHEQKYPSIPEPEAAILRSLDTNITYDINPATETIFMGKHGLFSFNLDINELIDKLYIPNKVPQGRVVDLNELLSNKMYYRKGEQFLAVTPEFLKNANQYIKKSPDALQQFFKKNNIKWRNFDNYLEFKLYVYNANLLLRKMKIKGIYKMFNEKIAELNNNDNNENKGEKPGKPKNEIFKVMQNKIYLVQKQVIRPPTRRIKTLPKPTILDARKNILAYNSEINGENRRFYVPGIPADILYLLKGNEEQSWALEQIFSRLYRENRIHDIHLTINTDWQKIALAAMRKILMENREEEIANPKYLGLKDKLAQVKAHMALSGENKNPLLQAQLQEIKQEMNLDKNFFYEAAVVLMDPSGKILVAASYPYDEETLLELNPELHAPFRKSMNPLLNRAWKWKYNPGSTAKIIDSIAFLCSRDRFPYLERLLTSSSAFAYFPSTDLLGHVMLNGKGLQFHLRNFEGHVVPGGFCSLKEAFAHSYNTYFAYLSLHTNSVLTVDSTYSDNVIKKSIVPITGFYKKYSILEYAEKLLLNQEINLLNNFSGTAIQYDLQRMPHDALTAAQSVFPVNAYRAADVAHYAIGQGDFQLTALQNAIVSSTILNDGELYFPSIINSITLQERNNQPGEIITPDPKDNKIKVFPSYVANQIKDAMQEVVLHGTAGGVFGVELRKDRMFYAKTGTSETGFSKDNALFTGFVQFHNNVQVIYSVIVPRSGLGARIAGKLTAQIMSDIIEYENKGCNPF